MTPERYLVIVECSDDGGSRKQRTMTAGEVLFDYADAHGFDAFLAGNPRVGDFNIRRSGSYTARIERID